MLQQLATRRPDFEEALLRPALTRLFRRLASRDHEPSEVMAG